MDVLHVMIFSPVLLLFIIPYVIFIIFREFWMLSTQFWTKCVPTIFFYHFCLLAILLYLGNSYHMASQLHNDPLIHLYECILFLYYFWWFNISKHFEEQNSNALLISVFMILWYLFDDVFLLFCSMVLYI